MVSSSDEILQGFEDGAALRRKTLLDLKSVDLSDTRITYRENGDGFIVNWPREYAPLQVWMESYLYYIGAVVCPLLAIPFLLMGQFNIGSIMITIAFLILAAYMALVGYNTLKKEYVFDLSLDRFTLETRHPVIPQLFNKTVAIPYLELRAFDLNRSGTEDNWGLPLCIQTKSERHHVSGRPKSVELLKGILEVLLLKVKGARKRNKMDDGIQIV